MTDYIRYRDYVPSMKEATACTWVETSDFYNQATVWSYATSSNPNEWLLDFLNSENFETSRRNDYFFTVPRMNGSQKVA